MTNTKHYNYVRYSTSSNATPQVGHLDLEKSSIQPLCLASGTPLPSIYAAIIAGSDQVAEADSPTIPLDSVDLLAPLDGRDILAIGKNYAAHADEFHASGYDSSDKTAMPSHPVIFSKRHTSIIPHGASIPPHPTFADTLDYEGEIGLIVGKAGYRIPKSDATSYIWGYTIINDVTSRNEQRDHKQFFLGKSADGYCPMGPIAVPREACPDVLTVETHVNGELRQSATTNDLIFDMPTLISTISLAQTLLPGDIIATGTPAGVGFSGEQPKWLRPNDEVRITVTGLGTLINTIGSPSAINPTSTSLPPQHAALHLPTTNIRLPIPSPHLTRLPGSKLVNLTSHSSPSDTAPHAILIHGLGGSSTYFTPLLPTLTASYTVHTYDFEGHGLTPSSPVQKLTIASLARDLEDLISHLGLSQASNTLLVAHSMGCLVALKYFFAHSSTVGGLVLMGPPPSPLPSAAAQAQRARAALVRKEGMRGCVDAVVGAGIGAKAKGGLVEAAVRASLLGTDAEGYAKACGALGGSEGETLGWEKGGKEGWKGKGLVLTGSEDKVCPEKVAEQWKEVLGEGVKVEVLDGVAHWHLFEDVEGCRRAVSEALGVSS
jgi:2-keto-4-pentenoate hydratase/2-oxohepta-3-ene-1,7-dioic acid hydratase in catechol pathway/pimeloyl-ACP methyl ester carboxylesterase